MSWGTVLALLFGPTFSQSLTSSQTLLMGLFSLPRPHTANLFLLISSILGSRTAGPHTQFVQWFMEECVDCLEQGSRGSILQFMPFTTVSASRRVEQPTFPITRGAARLSRGWGSAAGKPSG